MKITTGLGLAIALLVPAAALAAGGDALKIPASPRALAMGNASGALTDDVNALLYNPAGMASIADVEIALSHRAGTIDASEYLAMARPMKAGGVFGASVLYAYLPDINNDGATDPAVTANDMLVTAGYALAFATGDPKNRDLSAGLNVKWLRSVLGGFTATTLAADLGVRWQPPAAEALQVGLTLQNLGLPLKYIEESDPLPLTLKLGAAYAVLEQDLHAVNWAADLDLPLPGKSFGLGTGVEYWYNKLVAVRAGYRFAGDSLESGVTAGAGFRLGGPSLSLQLDYAFKPVTYAGSNGGAEHYLALMFGF